MLTKLVLCGDVLSRFCFIPVTLPSLLTHNDKFQARTTTQQNQKRLKSQAFKFNLKFQRTLRLKHIDACRHLAEPVGSGCLSFWSPTCCCWPPLFLWNRNRNCKGNFGISYVPAVSVVCMAFSFSFGLHPSGLCREKRDHSKHTGFPYKVILLQLCDSTLSLFMLPCDVWVSSDAQSAVFSSVVA